MRWRASALRGEHVAQVAADRESTVSQFAQWGTTIVVEDSGKTTILHDGLVSRPDE